MKRMIFAVLLSMSVSAVPAMAKKAPELTPLQLQSLQSREFETTKENLFGAVMTVLQDLGYQVQSADVSTGFITAVSATQNKTNFFEAIGGARSSGNTKLTSFIQAMPSGTTRVRLNFLSSKTTSMQYGQNSQNDKPVLDAAIYSNAWDKIDEALFVMGALEATPAPKAGPAPSAATQPAEAPTAPAN